MHLRILGLACCLCSVTLAAALAARPHPHGTHHVHAATHRGGSHHHGHRTAARGHRPVQLHGGNCVAYVRSVTGIRIDGDAGTWWHHAAGRYQRGQEPVSGAVLVFKPHGRMWHGHVAVVSRVVGPREILVDQANWIRGRVSTAMAVIDVSPENDWTMVKVRSERGGVRSNPTFGFVYPRPAGHGDEIVTAARAASRPDRAHPLPVKVALAGEARPEPAGRSLHRGPDARHERALAAHEKAEARRAHARELAAARREKAEARRADPRKVAEERRDRRHRPVDKVAGRGGPGTTTYIVDGRRVVFRLSERTE